MRQIHSIKIILLLVIPMMYTSSNYYWGEYFSLNIVEEKHEDSNVKKDIEDIFQDFLKSAFDFDLSNQILEFILIKLSLCDAIAGNDFSLLLFSPPE